MYLIDRYAQTNRFRRIPAVEKLALALGAMIVALSTDSHAALSVILLSAISVILPVIGVRSIDLVRAASVPMGFILVSTAAQATSLNPAAPFPYLSWTEATFLPAILVALRSISCVFVLLALAFSTPLNDIIRLLRRSAIGRDIGDIALAMWQFIWITLHSLETGIAAQTNRLGFIGYRRSLRSMGQLLAALLPRSLARARRLEIGLSARGFDGELRFLTPTAPVSPARCLTYGVVLMGIWTLGRVLV
ncbi:energy-coupling factor transporter transmembrane protein EcfT [Dongia sp.]|uniref:energy-coupling factor transporter transmembrane component T family protein n=1 Tax=Dongia sp. TaxID=1977262 RepID=UPI0035B0B1B9